MNEPEVELYDDQQYRISGEASSRRLAAARARARNWRRVRAVGLTSVGAGDSAGNRGGRGGGARAQSAVFGGDLAQTQSAPGHRARPNHFGARRPALRRGGDDARKVGCDLEKRQRRAERGRFQMGASRGHRPTHRAVPAARQRLGNLFPSAVARLAKSRSKARPPNRAATTRAR